MADLQVCNLVSKVILALFTVSRPVYSWLAVSVVPVVPVKAHDNEGQVGLEGSRFVLVTLIAFVLDPRPEVVAEKHVALRAENEGDEGTLVESEVLFRWRKAFDTQMQSLLHL